jgi:hypothetical protein
MSLIVRAALTLPVLVLACGTSGEPPPPSEARAAPSTDSAPSSRVVVNGKELTPAQMREFKDRYKVEPRAGSYWYDAKSGLWGLAGQPAAGFLFAGHDFGALAPDASKGESGVWLNGRHMPMVEVQFFASITGPILPGRYWLDGTGNVGYEGIEIAIGNLYQMAQMGAGGAGGGSGWNGGDNIWSTRFSAGNYNADNSAGYVSVPGVGPVSYGL